jgi:capsular exopolysaccharide synthesis family protein
MGRTSEALKRAEKEFRKNSAASNGLLHESDGAPAKRPVAVPIRSKAPKPPKECKRAECYQFLKTNLLGRYPDQCLKTLLFCSTAHGDGSTTTAVNFAKTLVGDCRMKVLLVDANFRTPCIHDLFQVEPSPGLSDYLANGAKTNIPMVKARLNNLYVLPCGSMNSNPIHLFETEKFDAFLEVASDRFDYVILDTPPLPSFVEARVICPKVDGVVLVVGAGKTRKPVAQRAKKELEEFGGKVLGLVINRRKFHIPEWIYRKL